jgi:hypothetical protein
VGLGVFCFFYFTLFVVDQSYLRIPIEKFSSFGIPIIKVQIESVPYLVEVDLGMARPLRLNAKAIKKIKNKEKRPDVVTGDIVGNLYELRSFQIPEIRLKNWAIKDIIISEEVPAYAVNTIFWTVSEDEKKQILKEDATIKQGTLGWRIFSQFACFFDFNHSEIFIGKNMASLLEAGCSVTGFVRVPFSIDQGGIILSITTDLGVHPFLLDTGATYSLVKQDLVSQEKIEKINPDIESYTTYSLLFSDQDLGVWTFRLFKMSDLYHQFDGVLGADFFRKHAICLDFQNKIAYIQPTVKL